MAKKQQTIAAKERQRIWQDHIQSQVEDRFLQQPETFITGLLRALRVFVEYMSGFWAFRNIRNCITVFGSARFDEDHKYYKLARATGRTMAKAGFTVMTGGGPGIMEAANRGAKDAGGLSVGCNILIPHEQVYNTYLDRWIQFKYFFVRKVMLTKYSSAFIVMPGGFGTMDEMFEMETLIQTKKIRGFPVVLMGADYWKPLVQYMVDWMLEHNTIDQSDLDKIFITDSPEEALEYIKKILNQMNNYER